MNYKPTIAREERRAYWNTYKIEENGSVNLFQVRQQDDKWYSRTVTRKKAKRVGLPNTQRIDAIEGEAYFQLANS
jgi:hypothetical protein